MREVKMSRGLVALVDDDDEETLSRLKWYPKKAPHDRTCYAMTHVPREGVGHGTILMHRVIMAAPPGLEVDHIDGNGLNNQRSNLRIVTRSQNMQNQTRKAEGCSSRFKGVCWNKKDKRWRATIRVAGKWITIGGFASEEEARDAYAAAAIRFYGEFANPYVEAVTK